MNTPDHTESGGEYDDHCRVDPDRGLQASRTVNFVLFAGTAAGWCPGFVAAPRSAWVAAVAAATTAAAATAAATTTATVCSRSRSCACSCARTCKEKDADAISSTLEYTF